VNSKEENSKDFCLNYVQEFGLRTGATLTLSFSRLTTRLDLVRNSARSHSLKRPLDFLNVIPHL
jgi:hypothetical protein